MSLDEAGIDDVINEVEGIPFVLENSLNDQFEGVKIDYKKTMFNSGFIISLVGFNGSRC